MPLMDVSVFDASQSAVKLVSEELLQKYQVLPLFRRGNRLFVGVSDPTQTRPLDDIKFHTNLVVEPILVDEDQIRRTLEQWQASNASLGSSLGDDDDDMGIWTCRPGTRTWAPAGMPGSMPRATTRRW